MIFAKKLYKSSVVAVILLTVMCRQAPVFHIAGYTGSESAGSAASETDNDASATPVLPPLPSALRAYVSKLLTFPDVLKTDWYYADIDLLYSAGMISGYPDGYFHPEREITNAEFIKILISTDTTSSKLSSQKSPFSGHWAAKYLNTAYERGIITDADIRAGFQPDMPLKRSVMTRMTILALGLSAADADVPFRDAADRYADTAYREYLLRGYVAPDGTRTYAGNTVAARCEAAAMAVRILDYRSDTEGFKRDAVLNNASVNPLNTKWEVVDLFSTLNREFIPEFTFTTSLPVAKLTEYYRHANLIGLEYFYNSSYAFKYKKGSTTYTLILEYEQDVASLKKLHTEAATAADKIIGTIVEPGMSEYDIVKAIHDYIVLNCAYDYDNYLAGTLSYKTRLAWGALCGGSAVCQGYTAAFNLLCRSAGIKTAAVGGFAPNSSDSHSWNILLLDGKTYYVDVTHDDPVPDRNGKVSYSYFCLTETQMLSLGYVWDKSYSDVSFLS